MKVERLPWAGLYLQSSETAIMIDPLFHVNRGFFGEPHTPFYPFTNYGSIEAILITHTHSDHFDPIAIQKFLGKDIPVFVPEKSVYDGKELTSIQEVKVDETLTIGDVTIHSSYSVDGLGDPQVSWIIQDSETTVLHCGDTLWHGYWWRMAQQYSPIDVACLPINGAIIVDPDLTPSGEPICLTPEQAISAAKVLQAKKVIPIHYGAFHSPPRYFETEKALERFKRAADDQQIAINVLEPGESLILPTHEKGVTEG